jgi:hypothetical protein
MAIGQDNQCLWSSLRDDEGWRLLGSGTNVFQLLQDFQRVRRWRIAVGNE